MASPSVHHLFHAPISDHSFSQDHSTLAVTRDNTVDLYSAQNNSFVLSDSLRGHDKTVTGVDIAPNSGKIVTCSQDRNAYVWEPNPTTGQWKPTLVLLRINRAATCVRWSPSETKFAVGSGARIIAVCYFEEENDWWISKHLKKPLHSTVTSVAWHPNSVLLAAGSTDGHARVFSSFIKGSDERPEPSVWGERLPFNTVCGEYMNGTAGWVHAVAFSPSGDALAFSAHDSSITIVYPSAPEQPPKAVISIATQGLPFADLIWISEGAIVCAGYDCEVMKFEGSDAGWAMTGSLEKEGKKGEVKEESALNMFRSMDLKGRSGGGAAEDTKLRTVHQNTINSLRAYAGSSEQVAQVSTAGVDGRVVVWSL
ncbi:probable Arp2/3 protein complex subunit sop2 [Ramularia collo-cygni]|uniref:Actin-related protein 2/3 complex subunit n=1 Tax=Ramularia collo-cygni TaxID=112498 RepID=A0A2D3VBW2_9PEZI|nr:probable Arp2/3 protein complex subunit sop2 [Ramularia collo-cygni]CZT17973.1 probable Arp2/3 protein complex subunit sop2 [Ramularia collo-cygni]